MYIHVDCVLSRLISSQHYTENFVQAIFDAIQLVASRPYTGIRNARAADMRSKLVARYPYRVHYRISDGDIWIVHVRHTARRPWMGDERS